MYSNKRAASEALSPHIAQGIPLYPAQKGFSNLGILLSFNLAELNVDTCLNVAMFAIICKWTKSTA
jgi:hypothetical protein